MQQSKTLILALAVLGIRDVAGHGKDEKSQEDRVDDDDGKGQARQGTNTAFLDFLDSRQIGAGAKTIDASATILLVGTVAGIRLDPPWLHARKVVGAWSGEVDLEGAAEDLLVAQKLEELSIVLGASSYQIHGFSARGADLHILAAVEEAASIIV